MSDDQLKRITGQQVLLAAPRRLSLERPPLCHVDNFDLLVKRPGRLNPLSFVSTLAELHSASATQRLFALRHWARQKATA